MRWPWSKPVPPPRIPPYKVPVQQQHTPRKDGITVEEHDTSAMTATGVHRAFDRLKRGEPPQ